MQKMKVLSDYYIRFKDFIKPIKPEPKDNESILFEREIEKLRINMIHKERNFLNAAKEYIDIAIKEMDLARERYETVLKEYKKHIGVKKSISL